MLRKETVAGSTFELLKELQKDPKLEGFSLAGGTALALLIGHRKSIDLDLFSTQSFDAEKLRHYLEDTYNFHTDLIRPNTLKGFIEGVAIDCLTHNYKDLEPRVESEGIRLYGYRDISAMKLNAIADNGTRIKDFVDVAYLSTHLSLTEMFESYIEKYPTSNVARPLRALTYYGDIDFDAQVDLIGEEFDWKKISKRLEDMLKHQDKIYLLPPIKSAHLMKKSKIINKAEEMTIAKNVNKANKSKGRKIR